MLVKLTAVSYTAIYLGSSDCASVNLRVAENKATLRLKLS